MRPQNDRCVSHSKRRRKKNIKVTERYVNGGGAVNPQYATKIVFVEKREKECSETKNVQKYFVTFLQGYPLKTFLKY